MMTMTESRKARSVIAALMGIVLFLSVFMGIPFNANAASRRFYIPATAKSDDNTVSVSYDPGMQELDVTYFSFPFIEAMINESTDNPNNKVIAYYFNNPRDGDGALTVGIFVNDSVRLGKIKEIDCIAPNYDGTGTEQDGKYTFTTKDGRLVSMTATKFKGSDSAESYRYAYNPNGDLKNITWDIIGSAYSASGKYTFNYDSKGRLKSIIDYSKDNDGTTTNETIKLSSYDKSGLPMNFDEGDHQFKLTYGQNGQWLKQDWSMDHFKTYEAHDEFIYDSNGHLIKVKMQNKSMDDKSWDDPSYAYISGYKAI